MVELLKFANSPVGGIIVAFILGLIIKRMKTKHLKILDIFIETIERIDEEVADIVPAKYEKKLSKAKKLVDTRLDRVQKREIDKALKRKGYLEKSKKKK